MHRPLLDQSTTSRQVRRVAWCAALLAVVCGCQTPASHADRGAIFGGLTGAGVGAAIGKANGNTAAGALIGSAVGAMTGTAIGDSIDADIAANQALVEQRMGRRMADAVTIPDVVSMTQAGLGDDVIITHIRAHGVLQRPTAQDLIALKNAGVSDPVLNAMQTLPPPTVAAEPAVRPVIVEEHYYGPPVYPYRHRHFHHRHYHPRHRPGVSWGFSFSN